MKVGLGRTSNGEGSLPEVGGPTTQSGILYQNSIAALYLGRLLDRRPVPVGRRINAVRLEAPEKIDDIVIGYANGSRLLIQAKESLSVSREACDRSQGKEDAAEWLAALNTAQKGLIDRVATALACSAEDVFLRVRRLTVEFLPRAHIESTGVRDWIPESSMKREALFLILRDACGGAGRVRAVFTAKGKTWLSSQPFLML